MASDNSVLAPVHQRITEALEVESLDVNLFRSKTLHLPLRARGVFGGQVISQALVSSNKCVESAYSLHSLHCYFLLSASVSVPILYHVDRVRDGRTYITRAVRAVQNGRTIFVMMCSYQLPEPRQPSYQYPMPPGVPSPENCHDAETIHEKHIQEAIDEKVKDFYRRSLEERRQSPIQVKLAGVRENDDELPVFMYWYRVKGTHVRYDAAFQKCILSYISDSQFITTARRTLAILNSEDKSPSKVVMETSLDHNITFYDEDFDCGDWLLYVIVSERAASGRASVHGRMYTRSGILVAICNQEGVQRVDTGDVEERSRLVSKL